MSCLSQMTQSLVGSEILKIAAEIQALKSNGAEISNFTVGDFNPEYFSIPEKLRFLIIEALKRNETNYPPSSGIMSLRENIAEFYSREFGYPTHASEVVIAGGARPLIYSIFTTLVDPGDMVLYPVPSWNNNHYVHLARAEGVIVEAEAQNGFMPTLEQLEPYIEKARLLCLNSPLNPTGTVFSKENLREISERVVSENKRRISLGLKLLYVMYDQIYFKLCHGIFRHFNPVALVPEIKPYTLFVDGISKYLCSTGLRVGWSILPKEIAPQFSNVLGHVGAWAPRPEQVAVADFFKNPDFLEHFLSEAKPKVFERLADLYHGLLAFKKRGLPVDVIEPQGGIYLSVQFRKKGHTNEQLRNLLLQESGLAVVPFQAFALMKDTGWFRFSVGAVSRQDISRALERLESFLVK